MTAADAFAAAPLDRAGDGRRRDPAWVAAQRADAAARALLAGSAGVVMDGERLARVPAAAADSAAEPVLLGIEPAGPLFAIDLDAPPPGGERPAPLIAAGGARGGASAAPAPTAGPRPVPLRDALSVLPRAEGGLVAYLAALLNWHRRHHFCAACGGPSEVREAGLVRACTRCSTEHHPRTDPVVIMLVSDGDRLLLGRQSSWPPRRYSALAGFVEPGETLEDAVVREVAEESGVTVARPRYVDSQPWPFPSSLMLGFEARWTGGEPRPHEDEIEDVRWFGRAEVAAAAAADVEGWGGADDAPGAGLLLPPRLAIARQLVERWLAA